MGNWNIPCIAPYSWSFAFQHVWIPKRFAAYLHVHPQLSLSPGVFECFHFWPSTTILGCLKNIDFLKFSYRDSQPRQSSCRSGVLTLYEIAAQCLRPWE